MYTLAGKNIVVGVSGSIAAFKVAGWVSALAKAEANVTVIMTEAAQRFVTPLTFAALSGNRVYGAMFAADAGEEMTHIRLAREADVMLIAPASAQTLARLAHGLADDLLAVTTLATRAPVLICPAMNSAMYSHAATRANLETLRVHGYHLLQAASGVLACGEEGQGRLAEWPDVQPFLLRLVTPQDLAKKKILVTAGPTREAIDPARFLSNRSSGKMGYALARAAMARGAEVVLVSGPSALPDPAGVRVRRVISALDMYEAVLAEAADADVVIKAAAVADYRPATVFDEKVKKDQIDTSLSLIANPDILLELGRRKRPGQILIGFAAETRNLEAAGRKKLAAKNLDLIAVNNVKAAGGGFEAETNQLLLIGRDQVAPEALPLVSKDAAAHMLLDRVSWLFRQAARLQ
ncbi:MAG: bifunctional phosphopantothenoylcysteine decarboxylase/phosphopantothenate--cysteine ligase CoaBC [Desulfobulbaceae bacterium]|jgi:phosphopantothenoylcysteine decarboxylase/phosphopantothenate--cysteine ligase|nr:bifunctional phosphopantothenoylcysteine decarboxylase/phosphopantothenate--cysteine ligase CoaBC [Desulfobulbaceae bacterium]